MYDSTTAAARSGRPLVLCVEDDPAQLRLLSRLFESDGFSVLRAATPEDAVELLSEAPVSLILADHLLRGVTGTQLAARFKAVKPTVPVLLHSGTQPDTLHNVDAFIYKGEPVRELLALARDLVKRFSS